MYGRAPLAQAVCGTLKVGARTDRAESAEGAIDRYSASGHRISVECLKL